MQTQKTSQFWDVFLLNFFQKKLDKRISSKIEVYYILNTMLMNKFTWIATKIKHFYKIFDKRTYDTFKNVVSSFIFLREHKQADIANLTWKALHKIQYFFNESVWDYKILNNLRLKWIRNKISWAWNKKSDILSLDSTIIAKSKNSNFSWLTNYFFSNKDKKIVDGFDIFWASIITKNWIKYILDICLYFKKKKNKLNNHDKRNPSIQNFLWKKVITKLLSKTKAWLVVLDSWFKWWSIAKWIFSVCKRHFLVRIWYEQYYYNKYWKCLKINKFCKDENAIFINWMKLWVLKNVELKSWYKKWIHIKTNLIIYHKNWFKNPVILCTSADIEDIYENMIRKVWDLSRNEKCKQSFRENALLKVQNENEIYFSFVLLYRKRWSIEVCFREIKTYLWFEKFQVRSYEAIMKYFHICILVHSLLYITLAYIELNIEFKTEIYNYLKEKRNIKNKNFSISFDWLKLFLEMAIFRDNNIFWNIKFSISLKSCIWLIIQSKLD